MINKIIITGANGFLGTSLSDYFQSAATEIVLLARKPLREKHKNIKWVRWDGETLDRWTATLEGADVLINLAGKSVDCRYTEENKKLIYSSRLRSTNILGEALKQCAKPPALWINASSATIYCASYDKLMTERDGETGSDFSMDVCKQWETEFSKHEIPGVRKIVLRTSIVMGAGGGALQPLQNLVRAGLGRRLGSGDQFFSWIHIRDFCKTIDWMINNKKASGIYNITAPNPLINSKFMEALRTAMHMPLAIAVPERLLRLGAIFIGTEPELVLKSRKVYPKRLLDEGFVFEFPDVRTAVEDLCRTKKTIT